MKSSSTFEGPTLITRQEEEKVHIPNVLRTGAAVLAASLMMSAPVLGQMRAHGAEFAGIFGWSSTKGADDKSHILGGASGGFNFTDRDQVFGEYTYRPLGSRTLSGVTGSGRQHDFGGGVRFHFLQGPARINPFLVLAGGGLRRNGTASSATAGSVSVDASGGYFGIGGGASLFLSGRVGIRPEVRYERLQFGAPTMAGQTVGKSFGDNALTIRLSLFVQAGGKSVR